MTRLSFLYLFFFMLTTTVQGQKLSDADREELRLASEDLLKQYSTLKQQTAVLLRQRNQTKDRKQANSIKDQIDKLYDNSLGQGKVEPTARIYRRCNRKGRPLKGSPERFKAFFNIKYFESAEAVTLKDPCLVQIDEKEKKIIVKFKSKYEIDRKDCRPPKDGYHRRLAYFKYGGTSGNFKVSFLSVQYEDEQLNCEDGTSEEVIVQGETAPIVKEPKRDDPVSTSGIPTTKNDPFANMRGAPRITFLAPASNGVVSESKDIELSIRFSNVSYKEDISIIFNGQELDYFDFQNNKINKVLPLLSGRNVITVVAQNSNGRTVKSRAIDYQEEEIIPLPQVEILNKPQDTLRNRSVFQVEAKVTGLQPEDSEKVYCIINGKVQDKDYFSNGNLLADVILEPGENQVVIVAANQEGVNFDEMRFIVADRILMPNVVVVHPSPRFYKEHTRIKDSVTYISALLENVVSSNDIQVLLDGDPLPFDYDAESQLLTTDYFKIKARVTGANTNVRIIVSNSVGESQEQHIRFRYVDPCASVAGELAGCRKKLTMTLEQVKRWKKRALIAEKLNGDYRSELRQSKEDNKKLRRQVHDSTMFIGVNFGIVKAPYQAPTGSLVQYDPIDQARRNVNLSDFSLSVYYLLGFWVGNYNKVNNDLPDYHYTQWQVDEIGRRFDREGIAYQPLQLESTEGRLFTINYGCYIYTYIKPVPLYLMLGLSHAKGEVWDNYSGDFGDALQYNRNDKYAVELREINTQKPIIGLAYVQNFVQVEAGYNFLYQDYFMNVGANYPLFDLPTKHFYLKRSRRK